VTYAPWCLVSFSAVFQMAASSAGSTPTKTIQRVCVSPSSQDQICLLCSKVISNKDYRRKLVTSGGRKSKICLNLEFLTGKEFVTGELITNILCRNCSDKNDNVVKRILEVRTNFDFSIKTITAEKGTRTSVKRLPRTDDVDDVEIRSNKKSLFGTDFPSFAPLKQTRDASTQVDFADFNEEDSNLTQVSSVIYKTYRCVSVIIGRGLQNGS